MNHKAPDPSDVERLNNIEYTWPPNISTVNENIQVNEAGYEHDWVVTTGDTNSKVRFRLFTREDSALLGSSKQSGATGSQSSPKTSEATPKPEHHTSIALDAKQKDDNSSD